MTDNTVSSRGFARMGWRARISIISPGAGLAAIRSFYRIVPEGVSVNQTIVSKPFIKQTIEELTELGNYVVDAAKVHALSTPDVILWSCTTGSLMKGIGYDQELIKKMEAATKIPCTTTATDMMAGLRKLGMKKLCITGSYPDDVLEVEARFLKDNGFEVLKFKGMGVPTMAQVLDVCPYEVYKFVKKNLVCPPEADGIFISCTGLDTVDIIEPLEHDLGKPVVTSNQTDVFNCLRIAKVSEPIEGFGRLLREPR